MSVDTTWVPRFSLDLRTAKPKDLADLAIEFERWHRAEPATEPLGLTNGWHTVTPQIAEQWLRRNVPGANRKLVAATVVYYGRMMQQNNWVKTGQPVIFTTDGTLRDAQHRLYACYLSGASFTTYVITDVEPVADLFAYIDNGRTRSPADALQTSGMDGLASTMFATLRMLEMYDHDRYSANRSHPMPRMSPAEIVHFARQHPKLQDAARTVVSDFSEATKIIGNKTVATFLALKLLELHDEAVLGEFYNDLGTPNDGDQDPVAVFQETMRKDRDKADQMKNHQVLGALINTFNAWYGQERIKKVAMRVNDDFPQIAAPVIQQQAAE